VLQLVIGHGMLMVASGLVVGLGGAFGLGAVDPQHAIRRVAARSSNICGCERVAAAYCSRSVFLASDAGYARVDPVVALRSE